MSAADGIPDQQPPRRYPAEDAVRPQQVSDPHTTDDETADSFRERWLSGWSTPFVIAAAVAALAIAGYGIYLFGGVILDVFQHTYVQVGLGGAFLIGLGLVVGASRERSAIAETDRLASMQADSPLDMCGEYVEIGDQPGFIPYKGRPGLLRSQQPYTVSELADEYPALVSTELDGDDPAVIMLWDAFTATAVTDRGVSVVTLAGGFEGAPFSSQATIKATAPELVQQDRLDDVTNTIEELESEKNKLERENSALQNQIDDLATKLGERREDVREDIVDLYTDLQEAHRADDGRRSAADAGSRDRRALTAFHANGDDES